MAHEIAALPIRAVTGCQAVEVRQTARLSHVFPQKPAEFGIQSEVIWNLARPRGFEPLTFAFGDKGQPIANTARLSKLELLRSGPIALYAALGAFPTRARHQNPGGAPRQG